MHHPEQRPRPGSWLLLTLFRVAACATLLAAPSAPAQGELVGLTAEERAEVDLMRRAGDHRAILSLLEEVLEEVPDDPWSLVIRGELRYAAGDYDAALTDLTAGLDGALGLSPAAARTEPELLDSAARGLARVLTELGRPVEALAALDRAGAAINPAGDARDAYALGAALTEAGRRREARDAFRAGADSTGEETWPRLLARGRCERALGLFERAARSYVAADRIALNGAGAEPDVLAELGELYLSVYGEVDDEMTQLHLPSAQHREALQIHPDHEAARLGLAAVYRLNWMLSRESPVQLVARALEVRPGSVPALLMKVSLDLDDGRLRFARDTLSELERVAPRRRAVRAERASLAWIEHERETCEALLAELAEEDPADSAPERTVARHLNEIYRFPEALPFAERACERDKADWLAWSEYGRALSGVGREDEAIRAFRRAEEAAEGRRDAWRANTLSILDKLDREYVEHEALDHTFVWMPDAGSVLQHYLVPFYHAHREGLAQRYGHTPGPVRIEVFRRWSDFSVRSTGFEGFSALGVCFGPVVTAVSPLSELRGGFSWARTAYHEYTHVIHLSLSHNRCPRWITEGLATWEEELANPAWSRNMRVDLVNAYANGQLIPVRDLNRAFRTPRILFAYYQGGLLCRMLIDEVGFSPMIRLLEAFDRGLDLDDAFREVLEMTPEEVDAKFQRFIAAEVAPLRIEPVWSRQHLIKQRIGLATSAPRDGEARERWVDDWLTAGWGSLQSQKRVDAEEALRRVQNAGDLPPRYHLLRGQILLAKGDFDGARDSLSRGIELGGDEFRARMALAELAQADGDFEQALAHLKGAERAFPGIAAPYPSPELRQAELHLLRGEIDEATAARRRWLAYNAGDVEVRMAVAEELDKAGSFEESETLYREANEVDPFHRLLHKRWGLALMGLGRHADALREFEVALLVPAELDRDLGPRPPEDDALWVELRAVWDSDRPELLGRQAQALLALGRSDEARARAEEALELDPELTIATEVLGAL